jgi:hypothetical protein
MDFGSMSELNRRLNRAPASETRLAAWIIKTIGEFRGYPLSRHGPRGSIRIDGVPYRDSERVNLQKS